MSDSIEKLQAEIERLQAQLAEAQQENRLLQEKLTAALDGTELCIWQGELQTGKLTVFNLQSFKDGEMAPNVDAWLAKLHPQDKPAALASYQNHLANLTPCYEAEYRTYRPDGSVVWMWDRGRVIERDALGRPLRIIGAHVNITRRKEYEQQLVDLALLDPLTCLVNRRQLMERLREETERACRHGQLFVLAMLDVDHFKLFNDTHGHAVGDTILVEMARTMQSQLREYDVCGRWGGEEFLVLLPNTSLTDAQSVIGRLHSAIRGKRVEIEDKTLSVTASIGIAEHRLGDSFSETLSRADAALLKAKRSGRDRILCA